MLCPNFLSIFFRQKKSRNEFLGPYGLPKTLHKSVACNKRRRYRPLFENFRHAYPSGRYPLSFSVRICRNQGNKWLDAAWSERNGPPTKNLYVPSPSSLLSLPPYIFLLTISISPLRIVSPLLSPTGPERSQQRESDFASLTLPSFIRDVAAFERIGRPGKTVERAGSL